MAGSSSTAACSSNNQWYDVFLNHRGPDAKETLARSLYLRLLEKGIRAFLDKDEMKQGYNISSQIEHAIKTASVHVAIFSPRYAESNWCLDELVMMLDSKAPIIPVFYGVTPAEVRWTRGGNRKYAQALQNLAKKTDEGKLRYESSRIENWRNALSKVADNSGFELEACKGEELELLDKLIKRLLEMLEKPKLDVARYPTGLDEKLKHFEDTVLMQQQQQSGKPQILGIWGLGGVGKTTMAKEFFNRKKSDYRKSCFLFEVRENAAKGSLQSLQRKLLKDITGLDKTIDSVAEGTAILKKHIEDLKSSNASLQRKLHKNLTELDLPIDSINEGKGMPIVSNAPLVILDDVDSVNQVYALLPVDLPSGSLVLITSRDKHVLLTSKAENSSIYMLTGLNNQHSRELFCSYAFSQTYPLPGFESLVDKFIEACNGLPLSLKVFGANLYGRDMPFWEDELGSFPTEIGERLKISYDALNFEEKHIFLDTACFFIGQDRDTTISTWDGSGWKGRRGFQILQDKCLVEVDEWNLIHMHDHLIDLGREIAEVTSPCRLWRWTENVIGNLLQQPSDVQVIRVRGIKMDRSEYNDDDDVLDAIRMRRLQVVDTEDSLLERILMKAELSNILWLRWRNCPYASMPSWFPLKNLRYLKVSGSVLNTLWQMEGESQAPMKLPVYLEEFSADGCVKLRSIRGLSQCTKLRMLDVEGCSELEDLPSMETLVYLEQLWAHGCVKLKSIWGLAQCTKLQFLQVRQCSELEDLPSMETMASLEGLWAEGCVKLKSIQGLAQCTKLQFLDVRRCSELEDLPSMETLVSLEKLLAEGCVKLKSIRGFAQCTKLRKLDVEGCSELEDLPSMETLVSLEELFAEGCMKLKSIRGLTQCTKLRKLDVQGCSELEDLPSMETLVSLEELFAERCVKLKSIKGLTQCTKLRKLDVGGCSELEDLPSMETLVSLEELFVEGCVKLKSIRGLAQCTKLRKLDVEGCFELEDLPSMETLVSLEELYAEGCVKLKNIWGLAQCTKLRKLDVEGCSDLEDLPSMETLVSLEGLWTDGCVKLRSIRVLAQCTKLQFLHVRQCSELEDLQGMETLVSLEELLAEGCVKLNSIGGLAQCTKLRKLDVGGCYELEDLPSLETLVSLEGLWVDGCVKLKSIRGLAQCTKLRKLNVEGCFELEDLPSMETLVSLEGLWAKGCVKVKSILGLAKCTKLQSLDVRRCSELEDLPSMQTLVSLEELLAEGCMKLKSIRGLLRLTNLLRLNVRLCSELEEVEGLEDMSVEMIDISRCPKLQCAVW